MPVRTFLPFLLLLAGNAPMAAAQSSECFCLSNAHYGYFRWACVDHGEGEAVCMSVGADGMDFAVVRFGDGWTRLEDGYGSCFPCMPNIRRADIPVMFRGLYFGDEDGVGKAATAKAPGAAPTVKTDGMAAVPPGNDIRAETGEDEN